MTLRGFKEARQFDSNKGSVRVISPDIIETEVTQASTHTSVNNPFQFMDSDVWRWFLRRDLYESANALGKATKEVAADFGISEEKLRIHFSFDGEERYAIVVRLPVNVESEDRFASMGKLENAFYELLRRHSEDVESFAWLRGEVSIAFIAR